MDCLWLCVFVSRVFSWFHVSEARHQTNAKDRMICHYYRNLCNSQCCEGYTDINILHTVCECQIDKYFRIQNVVFKRTPVHSNTNALQIKVNRKYEFKYLLQWKSSECKISFVWIQIYTVWILPYTLLMQYINCINFENSVSLNKKIQLILLFNTYINYMYVR